MNNQPFNLLIHTSNSLRGKTILATARFDIVQSTTMMRRKAVTTCAGETKTGESAIFSRLYVCRSVRCARVGFECVRFPLAVYGDYLTEAAFQSGSRNRSGSHTSSTQFVESVFAYKVQRAATSRSATAYMSDDFRAAIRIGGISSSLLSGTSPFMRLAN